MTTDDADDEQFAMVKMDWEHEVMLVRMINAALVPSKLHIVAELIPAIDISPDQLDIAISKVRFWLDAVVSRAIAFSRDNPLAHKALVDENGRNNTNNLLMMTPYEPTDEHMAALLQAKLTALGSGDLLVGDVTIRSNNMSGLTVQFVGDAEAILPPMSDWIGAHSYFEQPWWLRDDASTLDVVPPPDVDLDVKPTWAYSLAFLAQVGKPQPDVVVRPDFRPTVIDGGGE